MPSSGYSRPWCLLVKGGGGRPLSQGLTAALHVRLKYVRNLFMFLYFRERISKTEQLRQLRASELYDSVQLHATKGKKPPEYRKKT